MDVVKIDVIRPQPPQAVLQLAHQVHPAGPAVVGPRPHRLPPLGRQHDLAAAARDGPADHLLRLAPVVHIGRVEKTDPQIGRRVHDAHRLGLIGLPAEHHRAQAEP